MAAGFILLAFCLVIYFAPAIVATMRDHRQSLAIFFLNLLLGWTLVGWVVALVWALTESSPAPVVVTALPAPPIAVLGAERVCPHCAETIKAAAKICRYCGRDVEPVPN